MTLKSIFVPFVEERSAQTAFEAALTVAKETKAHISVAHIRNRPMPPTMVYYPLGGVATEFSETFANAENALAASLKEVFVKVCENNAVAVAALADHEDAHGVSASWRDEEGDLFTALSSSAAAHDLAVVAAAGDDATDAEQDLTENLLFRSGRPVLLCPQDGLAQLPKTIAVAWNGGEESARAVFASLALLQMAGEVVVVSVRKPDAPPINTDEITATLRLHGVKASRSRIEVAGDESVNARLDREIREVGPDLVVMGAYSHSRWREAVLGGFTRHMIRSAKIPVLMMN